MALHPVGPLAPATYWRRRAVLAGVVLLLLLLLTRCGGSSPAPTKKAAAPSAPRPAAAAPRVTTSPTPAVPVASAGSVRGCGDDVLVVVASADAPSYAVGASPVLVLTIRNGGTVPCRRDLGSAAVELSIVSGSDRVWSSDDCGTGSTNPVVLDPGQTRTERLVWSGRRSAPGCTGSKAPVLSGTYKVLARVGTLRRAGGTFVVRSA